MAREMKDSRIEWIGEIPNGWDIKRLKNLAVVIRGGSPRPIEDYLSPDDNGYNWIRIGDSKKGSKYIDSTARKIIPDGLNKTRFVKKGSLILSNSMSFGQPYILKIDGCIHDGWVALSDIIINKEFMYYFLISESARSQFQYQVAGGVVQNLNIDKIGSTFVPIPDYTVQQSIADFLDTQCAHIDSVIEKTRAAIEEYKKLKQAVITQAVTKGIRPNREMKDSGTGYIGQIPVEWEVVKLRYLGICQNGISKGGEYFGSGFPFVSYSDVYKNMELPLQVDKLVESTEEEQDRYSVIEGDIFFTRTSETIEEIGFTSVCKQTIEKATFAGFLIRVRPVTQKLLIGFSKYYFRSEIHRQYFVKEMNLVTRASLGQELLKNMPVLVPSITEQSEIVAYLDEKTAAIDSLIQKKEQLITELEAYKKSLIYEYVTGKKEVV